MTDSDKKKVGQLIPELQPVIEALFNRYATGSYSDQQMADWLNAQGYRRSNDRLYTKDNLRDMLQQFYYVGKIKFRGAKRRFKGQNYRAFEGEIVEGRHQAAISLELFFQCQQVRAERRRTVSTRQITRHIYYVNGIIVCAHCGRTMRAQSSRSNLYYREASKSKGFTDCPVLEKSVQAIVIDAQIGRIMQLIHLPDNWEQAVKSLLEQNVDMVDPEAERSRIRKALRDLRKMKQHGLYAGEEHVFWREVEVLQEELSRIEAAKKPSIHRAAETLLDLPSAWDAATQQEREELVKLLLKQVGCDLLENRVYWIKPKPVYEPLFQLLEGLHPQEDGRWMVDPSLIIGDCWDI